MKKVIGIGIILILIAVELSGCIDREARITAEADARLFLKESYCVKNIISSSVTEYSNGYIVTIKYNPCGDNKPTRTAKVYVNKDGRCSFDKW